MPPLPNYLFKKYTKDLGLSDYDANNIIDSKDIAMFYEAIINELYLGKANEIALPKVSKSSEL